VKLDPGRSAGQALVEFALAIMLFLFLLIGTIDLGRAVYTFNGVSEAAREVARETSLHPGSGGLGTSAETAEVVAVQKGLVPGLQDPTFSCVDIDGTVRTGDCLAGQWVRVQTTATYTPVMPVAAILGPIVLSSTSSAEIQ
jgi:Flp pilus assembly protein TadG